MFRIFGVSPPPRPKNCRVAISYWGQHGCAQPHLLGWLLVFDTKFVSNRKFCLLLVFPSDCVKEYSLVIAVGEVFEYRVETIGSKFLYPAGKETPCLFIYFFFFFTFEKGSSHDFPRILGLGRPEFFPCQTR